VVTDNGGLSSTATVTITVAPPPNEPPVAAVSVTPASGYAPLNISFSSAGSSDPDGTITAYSWNFGDGGSSTAVNPSHIYSTAGTFTATLTVTDNRGATNSKSVVITATPDPTKVLHVADIAMSKVVGKSGTYARAAVKIADTADKAASGVLVTGRWSGLTTGTATVSTDANGIATFTSKAARKSGTFTFTVTGVSRSGYSYDPGQNLETTDSISK
jgi:PKD repeat protein